MPTVICYRCCVVLVNKSYTYDDNDNLETETQDIGGKQFGNSVPIQRIGLS